MKNFKQNCSKYKLCNNILLCCFYNAIFLYLLNLMRNSYFKLLILKLVRLMNKHIYFFNQVLIHFSVNLTLKWYNKIKVSQKYNDILRNEWRLGSIHPSIYQLLIDEYVPFFDNCCF